MGRKRDYYEVLGIGKNADEDTIKKAYRKLAKNYHPDANARNPQAEEIFKEVTEAYDILSDPEKRKLYDRFGHAAFDGTMGDPHKEGAFYGYGGPQDGSYHEYHFEGGGMDDIFKSFFGGGFHEDRFSGSSAFRGGSGFSGYGRDGSDLHAEISISFDEAVSGCDKIIHLSSADGGNGGGKSLSVHIPAGIDTGKTIRLKGKGMPGAGRGKDGDLLLNVTVGTRPGFERRGQDVYTTISIPFTDAVFGGEAVVETLYGKVICKIAPGTQSGTKIRLKGKGIVSMNHPGQYGDQYVSVQIQVPRDLNENAKRKLREYEAAVKGGRKHAA